MGRGVPLGSILFVQACLSECIRSGAVLAILYNSLVYTIQFELSISRMHFKLIFLCAPLMPYSVWTE